MSKSHQPLDVKSALERLISGELRAEEAVVLAAEAGYRTFADLCEAELPEHLEARGHAAGEPLRDPLHLVQGVALEGTEIDVGETTRMTAAQQFAALH